MKDHLEQFAGHEENAADKLQRLKSGIDVDALAALHEEEAREIRSLKRKADTLYAENPTDDVRQTLETSSIYQLQQELEALDQSL